MGSRQCTDLTCLCAPEGKARGMETQEIAINISPSPADKCCVIFTK